MTMTEPFEGVPAPLRTAMVSRGFTELMPVQRAVVESSLMDRNLRISSQTGSGKTIAIGLVLAAAKRVETPNDQSGKPVKRPQALVIVPTRELAVQVQSELVWLFENRPDLNLAVVTGGADLRREHTVLDRGPAVVVGTPGRMLDHIRRGVLNTAGIEQVVLDEADRMLDMGFREELEAILESLPAERRSHLVSATFPGAVRRLADKFQDKPVHIQGSALGAANEDIEYVAHLIRPSDRYAALVNTLLVAEGARCLVFVERRSETAELAERLAQDGFAVQPFSGELAQSQRTRTLAAFRNGSTGILVSTDVAARGIDVPDIRVVIHATLPSDAETYVHRSGRTGRAGRAGQSVLLVPTSAERRARQLLGAAKIEADWRPVPTQEKVSKRIRKSLRRSLHARLDAEDGSSTSQAEYAAQLIEERNPVQVIATLLEMAEPATVRAPMPIAAIVPGEKPFRADRQRPDRPRADRPRTGNRDYVSYIVSWGGKEGASTMRLLSHVCRRGQISSREVGVIRIEAHSSRIEIACKVATAFERRVEKPDDRDPDVHISRDQSARPEERRSPDSPRGRAPGGRHPHGAKHRNDRSKGEARPTRWKKRKAARANP